jgi:hypothetical protein
VPDLHHVQSRTLISYQSFDLSIQGRPLPIRGLETTVPVNRFRCGAYSLAANADYFDDRQWHGLTKLDDIVEQSRFPVRATKISGNMFRSVSGLKQVLSGS